MTAPKIAALRASEPIIVPVALAERAYDIVIGRGAIASLGTRIKALRPNAKTVIVTDETVAKHHLAAVEDILKSAGIEVRTSSLRPAKAPRTTPPSRRCAKRSFRRASSAAIWWSHWAAA